MNADISDEVTVRDGILEIGGYPLQRYAVESEIGRGANGVVFLARRVWLDQPCVLKVWLVLRPNDQRDKLKQGLFEARKMAAASPDWVAALYDADVVGGRLVTSMELVPGMTLKQRLKQHRSKRDSWELAHLYMKAIASTTTETTAHGDAHGANVLVFRRDELAGSGPERLNEYGSIGMKLIDFGTSQFSAREASRKRHWKIVQSTFEEIVRDFWSLKSGTLEGVDFATAPDHLKTMVLGYVLTVLRKEAGITTYYFWETASRFAEAMSMSVEEFRRLRSEDWYSANGL